MKIYTKTGDKGETSLVTGNRVKKNHPRIEAYGTLDELNSFLGAVATADKKSINSEQYEFIRRIQNQLFNVGSQLACDDVKIAATLPNLNPQFISEIEHQIDSMTKTLPPLKNFILPGGSELAVFSHLARTVSRRAERLCVELSELITVKEEYIIFLNRLSDYLFVLARFYNQELKFKDVEWVK